jgi:hypothetical protein
MIVASEIYYLKQRIAAAEVAALAATDSGVRLVHKQFVEAYQQRMLDIVGHARQQKAVSASALSLRARPLGPTASALMTAARAVPTAARKPQSLHRAFPSIHRSVSDNRAS